MTKVNFADTRKQAISDGLLSGSKRFKVEEGENWVRLLSECLAHAGEFDGKPTFKWLCYIIDRRDGKIKPYFMPDKVYKDIMKLQKNRDYAFDEVPMPYDINIDAENAGKLEVKYSVQAARSNTPLTPAERALWQGTMPIQELQNALREESGASKGQTQSVPAQQDDDAAGTGDDGPSIEMEMPA